MALIDRCPAGLETDLAEVESLIMARLDGIERRQAQAEIEHKALHDRIESRVLVLDELLAEMSRMCGYLAAVTERLRANS